MQSLQNKTALITGGARGIGRAAAFALAKEGVHIGLVGRTMANLEKTAAELKAFGVNVSIAEADVKDLKAVENAVESVKKSSAASIFSLIMPESAVLQVFLNRLRRNGRISSKST